MFSQMPVGSAYPDARAVIALALALTFLLSAAFAQSAPTTVKVGQADFGKYRITLVNIDGFTNQAWLQITDLNGQYMHYVSSNAGVIATPAVIFLGETKTLNLIDGGSLIIKVVSLELVPGLSMVASATLEISDPGQVSVPSAPQNLAAQAGNGQVTLTWQAPSSTGGAPITNYKIYRGTTSANKALLVTVGNVLTFTDAGLTNGQQVFYFVSAFNSAGESLGSNEVTATPAATAGQTGIATATTPVIFGGFKIFVSPFSSYLFITVKDVNDVFVSQKLTPVGVGSEFTQGLKVTINSVLTDSNGQFTGAQITVEQITSTLATLSIAKTGLGSGTVTGSITGVNCGTLCTAEFNKGTQVTLTATPSAGSTFAGWSGTGINCPGTGTCTVTLNSNTAVTATFNTAGGGGGGQLPTAFTLATPATGSTGVSILPTFTWADSTGEATYTLQIATANTFAANTILFSSTTIPANTVSFTLPSTNPLPASTSLFWRVIAVNTAGQTVASNGPFSFTTAAAAQTIPTTFTITTQINGATGIALTPTFTWTDSTGETSYKLEIATLNTFAANTIVFTENTIAANTLTFNLPAGRLSNAFTYFWRVIAVNTAGQTVASNGPFSFTTLPADTGTGGGIQPSGGSSGGGGSGGGVSSAPVVSARTGSGILYSQILYILTSDFLPFKFTELLANKQMVDAGGLVKIDVQTNEIVLSSDGYLEFRVLEKLPNEDDNKQLISPLPAEIKKQIKFFQIITSPKLKGKISQAKITFLLKKEEIADTAFANVSVLRFTGGKWDELPKTADLSQKPDGSAEFTATTPDFSVFAIVEKPQAEGQTNQTQPTQNITVPKASPSASPSPAPVSGLLISGNSAVAVYAIVAILLIALLYTIKKNRDLQKPDEAEMQEHSPQRA